MNDEIAERPSRIVAMLEDIQRRLTLIEPKVWKDWDQVDSIYDEARLLRKERDEARAEIALLKGEA